MDTQAIATHTKLDALLTPSRPSSARVLSTLQDWVSACRCAWDDGDYADAKAMRPRIRELINEAREAGATEQQIQKALKAIRRTS